MRAARLAARKHLLPVAAWPSGGAPLFTVKIDQSTADGQNVDAVLLEMLAHQKKALVEQITMQEGWAES